MLNINKQISKLYLSSVLGSLSLTGAWVAILAARGYSLVEIGIAETVFHITSLLFEIPSGVFADVFGRKNMLLVSAVMRMIGNVIMIFSCNLFMVCTSIAFHALSYNFSSGSGVQKCGIEAFLRLLHYLYFVECLLNIPDCILS